MPTKRRTSFGLLLVQYLNARDLAQTALAEKMGFKPSYLSQVIRGKRSVSNQLLARIAQALQLTKDEQAALRGTVRQQPASTSSPSCFGCGFSLHETDLFCWSCGFPADGVCPGCGYRLAEDNRNPYFCPQCGRRAHRLSQTRT